MKSAASCIAAILLILLILPETSCNHWRACIHPGKLPIWEPFGPTDVNAISGNGRLTVLVNEEGTVTVFKWPNPSYYDQVKYFTSSRNRPRMGALANEGVFSGVYCETEGGKYFSWLRDWPHKQRYLKQGEAIVVTAFRNDTLGLAVTQTDWVDPDRDIFYRRYSAVRDKDSPLHSAKLMVYANFNPVVTKYARLPLADWGFENLYGSRMEYDSAAGVLVQSKSGKDSSTGRATSVAIAMGLDRMPSSYQAGNDSKVGITHGWKKDAFKLSAAGRLQNSNASSGQVTGGLFVDMDFSDDGEWHGAAIFTVASDRKKAIELQSAARDAKDDVALNRAREFWRSLLDGAPLPDTDDERILEVARASLVSLYLGYCKDTGAVVAGTSTQPPYGQDWPSNGSYINQAYLKAGWREMVLEHNRFYARTQSTEKNPLKGVPFGNWPANFYADGVPGMPLIPWEIDETGFMVWNLWSYYEATGDRAYLEEIYPTIKLAADFLADWRDPKTGLQRPAHEVDNVFKTQTVFGAATTCLGLKKAAMAARILGNESDRSKWTARYEELRNIVLEKIYNPEKRCFVRPPFDSAKSACDFNGLYVIWPAELVPAEDPRAQGQADALWEMMQPAINGEAERGSYESMAWLALAKAWKGNPEKLKLVQKALAWNARVPTTPTGLLGEVWLKTDSSVVAGESQPQLWNHALFYLAALEAFGQRK